MSDTELELAIRWSERESHIPAQVAAHLRGLGQAATAAAPEIGDRMGQAFARLEAREPTMVLRRVRFAIEEMAASAIGATGPAGRLAGSLALLMPGGAVALGAVAGLAGIGVEIKSLVEYSGQLEEALQKVNTEFASLGGAGSTQLRSIEALGQREPTQPGMFGRLVARLGTAGEFVINHPFPGISREGGPGDQQAAIEEGMAAQQATFDMAGNLMMRQFHARQEATVKRHGEQQRRDELKQIGLEAPDRAIHDLLANRTRFQSLGAEAAAEWAKAFLDAVKASGLGPTLREGFQPGVLGGGTRYGFQSPAGSPVRGLGETPTFGGFGPEPDRKTFAGIDRGGPGLTFHDIDVPRARRFEGKDDPRAAQNAERNAERMGTVLAREIGPLIALMAGGGARGAVGGLSAIAGTMASLRDAKGAAVLGSAAGPLAIASGLLGGLTALLGGGGQKPKVIITAFEEQALREIKQLRGEPLTTQIVVIGAVDMRVTQQALSRLARMGVITRLP